MIQFLKQPICISILPFILAAVSAHQAKRAHAVQKLDFLIGDWVTQSTWTASGQKASGRLRYEWVLGGAWLKITFTGKHPSRPVWEAHGMIRYLPERDRYESLIFAGPEEPVRLIGYWVNEERLRFEMDRDGVKSGIDYMPRGDGVYQENWREPKGEPRTVLLETWYQKSTPN